MGPQSEIPVSEPVEHIGLAVDPLNREDSSRKAFLEGLKTGPLEGRELGLIDPLQVKLLARDGHSPLNQDALCTFAGGAFADIYKARRVIPGHSETHFLALKVFRGAHLNDNEEYIKRVRKEYGVWEMLKHRNIQPLLGLLIHSKLPSAALVSVYKPLGDLHKVIQAGIKIPRLPMVKGIACGVAYLHKENVVHGDLSMYNILVDKVEQEGKSGPVYVPLITDFGKSRVLYQDGYTTRTGNPPYVYMPPELLECHVGSTGKETTNKTIYTPASDVYSFSLLMLELLSGLAPYSKDPRGVFVVAQSILNGDRPKKESYPLIKDSDSFCWPIMDACWKGLPADRITSEDAYGLLIKGPGAQDRPRDN